jgi:NADP-dependent 3-hydroxy acid dehydrogenase YdfG
MRQAYELGESPMALTDYKTALVTGASSGIGEATVRALLERGIQVYAAAWSKEKLDLLASKTGFIPVVLDVQDKDAIYNTLNDLEIDILVNNAGLGKGFEALFEANPDDIQTTLETNVIGAAHIICAVGAGMVKRNRGHVVNIAPSPGSGQSIHRYMGRVKWPFIRCPKICGLN